MTPESLDRIRTAWEDLTYLRSEWDQDVEDPSLRRSSPIFRRLLVEGELQRAWKDLGLDKQPIITAPSLEAKLKHLPLQKVNFAQAGGAKYHGMIVETLIEHGAYLTPQQAMKAFSSGPELPYRDYSLRRFMEGTCIVVTGSEMSRHTLVKYIANKLGGVHLDPRRDTAKDEERKFAKLDEVRAAVMTCDKPAIYFELLSIGQSLLSSADIERFLKGAEGVLRQGS